MGTAIFEAVVFWWPVLTGVSVGMLAATVESEPAPSPYSPNPPPSKGGRDVLLTLLFVIVFLALHATLGWRFNEFVAVIIGLPVGFAILKAVKPPPWRVHVDGDFANFLVYIAAGLLFLNVSIIGLTAISFTFMYVSNAMVLSSQPSTPMWEGLRVSDVIRLLAALLAFVIGFSVSAYFFSEALPWPKDSVRARASALVSAFLLSAIFGLSVWESTDSWSALVAQITNGMTGVLTIILAIVFGLMGSFLFWRRVKLLLGGRWVW